MLSHEVSGNSDVNLILQLAQIIAANPWVRVASMTAVSKKRGRSLIERQVLRLVESIGADRQFSLAEVVQLLINVSRELPSADRLLVAPVDMLDAIPPGRRVRAIPDYLQDMLRTAQHEVLLLAPFWDMPTLVDLLRCVPQRGTEAELVLLFVHMGRRLPNLETMVNAIQSVWPSTRIRVFVHLASRSRFANYPHAKCLVVDRSHGYLGSANFTGQGMRGHFEVGVALSPSDSRTLGDILQHLWSKSGLFVLAWDSSRGRVQADEK